MGFAIVIVIILINHNYNQVPITIISHRALPFVFGLKLVNAGFRQVSRGRFYCSCAAQSSCPSVSGFLGLPYRTIHSAYTV